MINNKQIRIVQLSWQDTIPLRHTVLWPNESLEFCKVEGDEAALHYGIVKDEKLVCVASIYINKDSARLRKFATIHEFQGQGFGSYLLTHIFNNLKKKKVTHFWCDARVESCGFYTKLGMKTKGEQFYKSDLPYIIMERFL